MEEESHSSSLIIAWIYRYDGCIVCGIKIEEVVRQQQGTPYLITYATLALQFQQVSCTTVTTVTSQSQSQNSIVQLSGRLGLGLSAGHKESLRRLEKVEKLKMAISSPNE